MGFPFTLPAVSFSTRKIFNLLCPHLLILGPYCRFFPAWLGVAVTAALTEVLFLHNSDRSGLTQCSMFRWCLQGCQKHQAVWVSTSKSDSASFAQECCPSPFRLSHLTFHNKWQGHWRKLTDTVGPDSMSPTGDVLVLALTWGPVPTAHILEPGHRLWACLSSLSIETCLLVCLFSRSHKFMSLLFYPWLVFWRLILILKICSRK